MRIVKKNGMRKNRNSNYLTIFKGNALFTSLRTGLFLIIYNDSNMSKLETNTVFVIIYYLERVFRCSKHAARSHRTGRRLAVEPHSAVRQHCEQASDAPISIDSFKVIVYDKNSVSLLILESLYIFKNKPVLNDVNSAFPLNIIK